MFSLVNNRDAADLRRHCAQYDVIVMIDVTYQIYSSIQDLSSRSFAMYCCHSLHYNDVIMITMASQITSLAVVYSIVYSDADQRKHQSSVSLAFVLDWIAFV